MSQIDTVVVGAGHLGHYHVQKVLADPQARLVGVVDPDPGRCRHMAALHRAAAGQMPCAFAADVASLDVAAHAAIIATPTITHLDVARACLTRGWHVLVEKPLAHDSTAARALVQAGHAAGRLVQVGHLERYNPAIVAGFARAPAPRFVVAERLGPFSGRATDVDVVMDLMIHDLDLLAAYVQSPLVETRAVGVAVLTSRIDMASARLVFANGTVAQLSAGRTSLRPSRKLRLFSASGYVSVDAQNRTVQAVRRAPESVEGGPASIEGETVQVPDEDALAAQDAAFFTAVRSGEAPRVDGAAGVLAIELAEAIHNAMAKADANFSGAVL